ncbi:hypothetical protein ACFOU2_20785 [Bacillus songklensis]|uniref:Holin-like Toxin (Hol-Tox) n=1 Tax=Bacillus songklensis TaxID=1069116 RepID=A0ABV8B9E7_9BACI
MFGWFEQLLQLFALGATIFTTITIGIKNINEMKKKTKRKRRFL